MEKKPEILFLKYMLFFWELLVKAKSNEPMFIVSFCGRHPSQTLETCDYIQE